MVRSSAARSSAPPVRGERGRRQRQPQLERHVQQVRRFGGPGVDPALAADQESLDGLAADQIARRVEHAFARGLLVEKQVGSMAGPRNTHVNFRFCRYRSGQGVLYANRGSLTRAASLSAARFATVSRR